MLKILQVGFQQYVNQELAEEPEIKFPSSVGSQNKPGNSRKTSVSLTVLKPLTMWIQQAAENS